MDMRVELKGRTEEIEAVLRAYLPKEDGYQRTIMEAMNYSVLAGGKRLRPMLMLETYRLFGGTSRVIEPFLAAIELIHTYSLVHDDLPAMDNDEYRRGKKTTHAVYGEAMGILAGDALLNYAYETAARAFSMEPENPRLGRAFQILAEKSGIYGMVGGQVVDVEAEGTSDITASRVIEPFLAAIELIHTYSLVHDDLPAMDNDEYRRGKKTTHAVYGEAMGILAGDALLNYAYETAARAFSMEPENPRLGRAFQILAEKSGIYGMVGGQVVDVEAEGTSDITREKLDFIYRLKTGALLEGAMRIGAVLAGAGELEQQLMENVAAQIGLAFQIQDDILDVTSTMEVLGKPIGSDERNQKATYVTFVGLAQAGLEVKRLCEHAIAQLETLPVKNEFLTELLRSLIVRER